MSLEAYGNITAPLADIQGLVAGTLQFQAWCRESITGFPEVGAGAAVNLAAALNQVRIGSMDMEAAAEVSPVCVVAPLPEYHYAQDAIGPTTSSRGIVLLKFRRLVPDAYIDRPGDALLDFGGCREEGVPRGLIVVLDEAMAAAQQGGHYPLRRWELMAGPGFVPKSEVRPGGRPKLRETAYCDVLWLWGVE